MYDDDSDSEKVGKKVAQRVKRVARGTRRMSLMAADNVKNVAAGQVKKVAQAADGITKKKKKKKKKKKEKKEKKEKKKKKEKEKKRGRSESPRRSTNAESSKPPVTKPGGVFKSLFNPKRWRSASPMVGRGKKNKNHAETVDSDDDMEPLAPLPTFDSSVAPGGVGYGAPGMSNGGQMMDPRASHMSMPGMGMPGMPGMAGQPGSPYIDHGANPYLSQQQQANPYINQRASADAIGASMRSLSSSQRAARNQQQERIERENEIPFVSKFLRSKHFVKYCDIAFDHVDSNGDEAIDETELYAGLLFIHLKLGSFLGPAACKPLSRARCKQMFQKFDSTGTGGLDRSEFRRVMMVLFGNIFARVVVQYGLTIFIVPLIAKSVLNFLTWDSQRFWDYWTKPKALRKMGVEFTLDYYVDWNVTSMPSTRRTFFTKLFRFFRLGSDEFWATFPLTFMTIVLGIVIAPLFLYYFDDLFQYAVEYKEKQNREKAPSSKKK